MKKRTKDSKLPIIIKWIIIILIILVGIMGIYVKKLNKFVNIIPDYNYGMDIIGNRQFFMTVDKTEQEKTVYIDEKGNIAGEVIDENISVNGYNIEKLSLNANKQENLTIENYELTKAIMEKRLKKSNVNEYNLKLDRQTGNMILEIVENNDTNTNYSLISTEGKFEIIDAQTGIILMNNSDIKSAAPVTNPDATGANAIYLQLELTDEGTRKINEISKKYIEYKQDGEEESKIDYITIRLDDQTIYTTYFNEEWTSNFFHIPVSEAGANEEELKQSYSGAYNVANIINNGKLPIKYILESDEFIKSSITENDVQIFKYIVLSILVLITIIFFIIFKLDGLKYGILNIGFVSLYSIILRYLKVEITLPGIISIIAIILINLVFYYNLLKKKIKNKDEIKQYFYKFNILMLPVIIMAIVFTLSNNINTLSIGMVTFWGFITAGIYNWIFVKNNNI